MTSTPSCGINKAQTNTKKYEDALVKEADDKPFDRKKDVTYEKSASGTSASFSSKSNVYNTSKSKKEQRKDRKRGNDISFSNNQYFSDESTVVSNKSSRLKRLSSTTKQKQVNIVEFQSCSNEINVPSLMPVSERRSERLKAKSSLNDTTKLSREQNLSKADKRLTERLEKKIYNCNNHQDVINNAIPINSPTLQERDFTENLEVKLKNELKETDGLCTSIEAFSPTGANKKCPNVKPNLNNRNKKVRKDRRNTILNIEAQTSSKRQFAIPNKTDSLSTNHDAEVVRPTKKLKMSMKYCSKKNVLSQNEKDCANDNQNALCKEDASDESESDWEEVPQIPNLDEYNPEIPVEGVEITIKEPLLQKKRKNCAYEFANYARMHLNRFKKDTQLNLHKVHLLCWLAHGISINGIINEDLVQGLAMSLIPKNLLCRGDNDMEVDLIYLKKFVLWFKSTWTLEVNYLKEILKNRLCTSLQNKKCLCKEDMVFLFIALARMAMIETRLCYGAFPITYKATDLLKKQELGSLDRSDHSNSTCITETFQSPLMNKINEQDIVQNNSRTTKNLKTKNKKKQASHKRESTAKINIHVDSDSQYSLIESSNEDEEDYGLPAKTRRKTNKRIENSSSKKSTKAHIIKIVSSDSDNDDSKMPCVNYWAEVYLPQKKKWVCVDVVENIIDSPYTLEKNMSRSTAYILGINKNNKLKDLTRRYASQWLTHVHKQRPDQKWWDKTMEIFMPPNDKIDQEEEAQLQESLLKKPLPTNVGEFKNHPLYVLKRHLLKYEAIYPEDSPSLGFLRNEPIFARECVYTLHNRDSWLRQARVVNEGEKPYKLVKSRPKWDKVLHQIYTPGTPTEIFGIWQTQDYVPPTAKDGKVPRNGYGNVELFKDCMLPKGTVHLQLTGLNRIARKLDIDCAPAVVGFDIGLPRFDGFVVCEEFQDILVAAWEEEQINIEKREIQKREERVLGNWTKLVKGVLIRERVKTKYCSKK